MFTLVGFNENAASVGALVNIAGAADQMTTVVADVVYVPDKFNKILWVAALGYDVVEAKLESPTIRKMGVLIIEPKSNFDYDRFVAFPVARYTGESPLTLATAEGMEAFVYCGSDVTHFVTIAVCLGDAPVTPVTGEIHTIIADFASTTLVESSWTNTGVLTFRETLPVGRYQVVGAAIWHGSANMFRLVPVGAPNRPGGLTAPGVGGIEPMWQRFGHMGVWCEFHSTTPPTVDILGVSAGASAGSVWLDVIKVA